MVDIFLSLFVVVLILVGFVLGNRALLFISVVFVSLLWLIPVFAKEPSFRWTYSPVEGEAWVGEITITNPTVYDYAMAGPNGVRQVEETITIETEQGPITILATITRNTDCADPCPDIYEVVSWPDGYSVSPSITEITEEKSQVIKIYPLTVS